MHLIEWRRIPEAIAMPFQPRWRMVFFGCGQVLVVMIGSLVNWRKFPIWALKDWSTSLRTKVVFFMDRGRSDMCPMVGTMSLRTLLILRILPRLIMDVSVHRIVCRTCFDSVVSFQLRYITYSFFSLINQWYQAGMWNLVHSMSTSQLIRRKNGRVNSQWIWMTVTIHVTGIPSLLIM